MKRLNSPEENLILLFEYVIEKYERMPMENKEDGIAQFILKYEKRVINCYLKIENKIMTFHIGEPEEKPRVRLYSSYFVWLDLAAKRLNSIWAVITQRLKLRGDIKFFMKSMPTSSKLNSDMKEFQDPVTKFEKNPVKYWKKPKKVVILNGSPRGKRGLTAFFLAPYIEGMEAAGAEVELINLNEKTIKPCTGCWRCWFTGTGECVFKDDMQSVYRKHVESDMIVMAFPIYVDNMPGILKNYFDRTVIEHHPYIIKGLYKSRHPRRERKDRSLVMFSICGFPEVAHFNAVRAHFKEWSHESHMPLVAEILRTECSNIYHSPLNYKILLNTRKALYKAGEEVVRKGKVSKKWLKDILKPSASLDEFRIRSNGIWQEKIESGDLSF